MDNELSTFNVIHWECNLSQLEKPVRFNIETGVTGGWLNNVAVLLFRWRVMCYVENTTALHFVAENNYTIPNLASFDEPKMKAFLIKSYNKVGHELGVRTKETGNVFMSGDPGNFPDSMISKYYKEFLQALNVR